MRALYAVLLLLTSGCANVVRGPVTTEQKNNIVIRLIACEFMAIPIGDAPNGTPMYLIKWNCPWAESN